MNGRCADQDRHRQCGNQARPETDDQRQPGKDFCRGDYVSHEAGEADRGKNAAVPGKVKTKTLSAPCARNITPSAARSRATP